MLVLTLTVLLGGCFSDAKPVRNVRKERAEKTDAAMAKTPVPRTYRYPDGEMRVFEVPVKDPVGGLEYQRCYVWKDQEFKTSTISCGQMPEIVLAN